mgnify:CR=1 FL=1
MDKLNLEIGWDVDNPTLKAEMDRSRKEIEGVGQSVEETQRKVDANIKSIVSGQDHIVKSYQSLQIQAQSYAAIAAKSHDPAVIAKYNQKLAETKAEMERIKSLGLDIGSGPRGGSGWNGLQNSINQISRELPAFTYSAQTGFMAISNNIPILVDEINRLKVANAALNAEGKKGVPVWRQVVSGLFSWQTALMLGVTLLTVYGKEIGNFFVSLFKGSKAINQAKENFQALNAVMQETSKEAAKELTHLKVLSTVAKDVTRSTKERTEAAKQLQSLAKEHNKQLSTEAILAGEAASQYRELAASIFEAARARAAENKLEENAARRLDLEFQAQKVRNANANEKARYDRIGDESYTVDAGGYVSVHTATAESKKRESDKRAKAALDEIDSQIKVLDKTDEFLMKFVKVEAKKEKTLEGANPVEGLFDRMSTSSKKLLQDLADLDAEYARKSMDSDEAELQAVRDKFDKFRRLLEKENEEIRKYNEKNAKKKSYQPIALLDVGAVDPVQQQAESNLAYTQQTARLQKQLDEEYKVFQSYEQLKKDTSEQYANERYADQLEAIKSYEARLAQEIASIDPATTNALEKKRLEGLLALQKDQADKRKEAEDKAMSDLLALMVTYDQRRKKLLEKQEADRLKVAETATAEELAELDRLHAEELGKLDDANIQKLDSYKELFSGVQQLSDAAARKVIANAKSMLAMELNMSGDERKKIEKAIADAEKSLDGRLYDRVGNLADEFSEIAYSVGQVNEGLGDMLGLVSSVLRATVDVSKGIENLKAGIANYTENKTKGDGGILGSISAIAGIAGPVGQIVGAVSSVVSSVIGFFKASKESARQAAEEIKRYQDQIIAGELEYNRILRERSRSGKAINDMTLKELELQKQLLQTQLEAKEIRELTERDPNAAVWERLLGLDKTTVEKELSDYEYMLARLQNEGQEVTGQRTEKYGGFLGIGKKTRVVDVTASLGGKTYEELERLYTEGKMTESTRVLFEQLQKAKDEVEDINDLMKEIDEALADRMSGGATAGAISSSIIQGFKGGKRAVLDFADDAEEIIQNALLSAMSATVLEEPLQELIRQFRDDAKDGLSNEEIEKFKQGYASAVQSGLDAIKEIEKMTGKQIGKDDTSTLTGRINRNISEDTGSAILGFERSRYDLATQQLDTVRDLLSQSDRSHELFVEQLRTQAAIELNTRETVTELKVAVTELKAINKNTSSTSARGLGL